ncbi:hypothetical protein B0H17DRAFT_1136514 [Mycena rosella]|uniref:Uncharacterized protein n=1 Tax=Mycena rosella TaxID=1033263 RepID=A0AAD7DAK5_MYCRO|nr:hypothetical protein B0H17DRAFT_1136514 [Mycena rosella]
MRRFVVVVSHPAAIATQPSWGTNILEPAAHAQNDCPHLQRGNNSEHCSGAACTPAVPLADSLSSWSASSDDTLCAYNVAAYLCAPLQLCARGSRCRRIRVRQTAFDNPAGATNADFGACGAQCGEGPATPSETPLCVPREQRLHRGRGLRPNATGSCACTDIAADGTAYGCVMCAVRFERSTPSRPRGACDFSVNATLRVSASDTHTPACAFTALHPVPNTPSDQALMRPWRDGRPRATQTPPPRVYGVRLRVPGSGSAASTGAEWNTLGTLAMVGSTIICLAFMLSGFGFGFGFEGSSHSPDKGSNRKQCSALVLSAFGHRADWGLLVWRHFTSPEVRDGGGGGILY